jgi:hypothetical protein
MPIALGAVAALLLAGCFSPTENAIERAIEQETGQNADVDIRADGSMKVETADGSMETGGDVPSDWPSDAPAYPGATVSFSAKKNPTDGSAGTALSLVTDDTTAEVVDFYTNALKNNGWAVQGTMNAGPTTIMAATKGTRNISIMIAAANDKTSITIGIEGQ